METARIRHWAMRHPPRPTPQAGIKVAERKSWPCQESHPIPIIVHKRSWCDIWGWSDSNFHKERKRSKKKEKRGRGGLWKLTPRWTRSATFNSCPQRLGKAFGFPHSSHRPGGDELNKLKPDRSFATKSGHFHLLPTGVVRGAMLLGSCRKWLSRLNGQSAEPIGNLYDFLPVIAEVQREPCHEDIPTIFSTSSTVSPPQGSPANTTEEKRWPCPFPSRPTLRGSGAVTLVHRPGRAGAKW